jgi:hypothetical protein
MPSKPFYLLLLMIFLVACTPGTPITQVAKDQRTPSPLPPTFTIAVIPPTPSPSAYITKSPVSTITLNPKRTATPQPTDFVPEWLRIISQTRTLPAIALTDMIGAPGYGWWESPDGKWIVEDDRLRRISSRRSILHVIRLDGKVEWIVDFVKTQNAPRYEVAGWSPDGNFLYISYRIGFIDGNGLSHCRTNGLIRMDLSNGSTIPFLNFGDEVVDCWNYSFSDPATSLAYIPPGSPSQLIIMDLHSGKKSSVLIDKYFSDTQPIVWSPDRNRLLIIASHFEIDNNSVFPIVKTAVLFQFTLTNSELQSKEIMRYPGSLHIEEWKGDLVLISRDVDNLAWVALSSQIVMPVTRTPTPKP